MSRPEAGPAKYTIPRDGIPGGQIPAQGEPDQPGLGLPAFGSTLPTPRASVNFRQEVWTFASGGGLLGSLDSIHVLDLPRFRGDPETGGNSLRKELTMPRSRPPYPREFREEATRAGPELGPARRGAWHRPRDPERVGEAGGAGRGAPQRRACDRGAGGVTAAAAGEPDPAGRAGDPDPPHEVGGTSWGPLGQAAAFFARETESKP
jgi:hypothetical protein